MGTMDLITMKVSTFEAPTTAFPAVMVTKNIPAAGKKLTNFFQSNESTSTAPNLPSTKVVKDAKTNWTVASVQTYGKRMSAHLLITNKLAAQIA